MNDIVKRFLGDSSIAVHTGGEHLEEFMQWCESVGLAWGGGNAPTAYHSVVISAQNAGELDDLCIECVCGNIYWAAYDWFNAAAYEIYDAEEFLGWAGFRKPPVQVSEAALLNILGLSGGGSDGSP